MNHDNPIPMDSVAQLIPLSTCLPKGGRFFRPKSYLVLYQSHSQSFVPLDQRLENKSSGSIHFDKGNNRILHIRFHCVVLSLHLWYLWRMPEIDAPRALVFQLLVKGNEALGTRLVL